MNKALSVVGWLGLFSAACAFAFVAGAAGEYPVSKDTLTIIFIIGFGAGFLMFKRGAERRSPTVDRFMTRLFGMCGMASGVVIAIVGITQMFSNGLLSERLHWDIIAVSTGVFVFGLGALFFRIGSGFLVEAKN